MKLVALLLMLVASPAFAKCHDAPVAHKKHAAHVAAVKHTDGARHTEVPVRRDTVYVVTRGEMCRIHYQPQPAREVCRGSSTGLIVGAAIVGVAIIVAANQGDHGASAVATASAGGPGCPPPPPPCPPKKW